MLAFASCDSILDFVMRLYGFMILICMLGPSNLFCCVQICLWKLFDVCAHDPPLVKHDVPLLGCLYRCQHVNIVGFVQCLGPLQITTLHVGRADGIRAAISSEHWACTHTI